MSESAAAGWYPQPDGTQRYWDGAQWTDHVSGTPAAPAAPVTPPTPPIPASVTPPTPPAPVAAPVAAPAPVTPPTPPIAASVTPPTPPVAASIPAPPMTAPAAVAGAPAAPRKKKKWPWIVGGIALVLALIVVGIVVAVVGVVGKTLEAPKEAVLNYDKAWTTADCDLLNQSTTSDFRESNGWSDCDSFLDSATGYADLTDSNEVSVSAVNITNNQASVTTHEVWTPTEGDVEETTFIYTLVHEGGAWRIDGVTVD